LQKLRSQFGYGGVLVDFDVAQEAKALADGTRRAEFASGQSHGGSAGVMLEDFRRRGIIALRGMEISDRRAQNIQNAGLG